MSRTTRIPLSEIPLEWNYQGYVWYSNSIKPDLILDKDLLSLNIIEGHLPFIVEGNLWCSQHKVSFCIRGIDGTHHVIRYNLQEMPGNSEHFVHREFITHDIEGFQKYKVKEGWEEQEDPISKGFTRLTPVWTAFTGFQQ